MRDGVSSQFVRRLARGRNFLKEGDDINRVVIDSCGANGLLPKRRAMNSKIMSEGQGRNVNLAVQNDSSGRIPMSRKKNKEGGSSSKLSIGSRILRALSRIKEDGKTSNIKEKDRVFLKRKHRLADEFENTENENEEVADEFVSVKVNKEANNGERELKQKRGRPRIIDLSAQDDAFTNFYGVTLDECHDMCSTRPMIMLKEGDGLFVYLQGPSVHDDLAADLTTQKYKNI